MKLENEFKNRLWRIPFCVALVVLLGYGLKAITAEVPKISTVLLNTLTWSFIAVSIVAILEAARQWHKSLSASSDLHGFSYMTLLSGVAMAIVFHQALTCRGEEMRWMVTGTFVVGPSIIAGIFLILKRKNFFHSIGLLFLLAPLALGITAMFISKLEYDPIRTVTDFFLYSLIPIISGVVVGIILGLAKPITRTAGQILVFFFRFITGK